MSDGKSNAPVTIVADRLDLYSAAVSVGRHGALSFAGGRGNCMPQFSFVPSCSGRYETRAVVERDAQALMPQMGKTRARGMVWRAAPRLVSCPGGG